MRWVRYLLGTLTAVIIAVGVLLPLATRVAPALGHQIVAVRGGSMEPAIPLGALIIVTPRDPADLVTGDIITWRGDNDVWVTHRIVEIFEGDGARHFRTQGDANPSPDGALVPQRAVIGSVDTWVPGLGYALLMLATPTGVISWLSFGLALLVADSLLTGARTQTPPDPPRRDAAKEHPRLRRRRAATQTETPVARAA